jgi:hypothetical protein
MRHFLALIVLSLLHKPHALWKSILPGLFPRPLYPSW